MIAGQSVAFTWGLVTISLCFYLRFSLDFLSQVFLFFIFFRSRRIQRAEQYKLLRVGPRSEQRRRTRVVHISCGSL